MTQKLFLTAIAVAAGLIISACGDSPTSKPLRLSGAAGANYSSDLSDCRRIAMQYDNELTAQGAMGGAVLGGAVGAIESHEEALAGAAVGGILGAVEGNVQKEESQREMIIRCMQNRGHPVIG